METYMKFLLILITSINMLFGVTVNLTSGDTQSGSVTLEEMNYYKIPVQNGQDVEIIMNQLSADADLYVKIGSTPTRDSHDCTSLNGSINSERCVLSIGANSDVFIGVYGYRAADYDITATVTESNPVNVLAFDTPVNASVAKGQFEYYKISAMNEQVLNAEISNLAADADIYLKVGSKPTTSIFDCKSTNGGTTNDSCSLTMNADADVYLAVHGYQATDYRLNVTGTESIVSLTSGVGISKNIQQGKDVFYKISGLQGQQVEVILDNLSNDADLSTREVSKPTDTTFDCKSSNGGTTTDSCTLTFTQNAELYIRIYGYRTSDYRIKATVTGDDTPILISGVSVSGTVTQSEMKYYKIPALFGQDIEGRIDLLTDDSDIYIKKGSKPTTQSYDCRSTNGQTIADSCSVTVLNDEDVFIGVLGYRASDYRLTVTTTSEPIPANPTILEDAEGGTLNPNWIHTLGNVAPYIVATPNIPGAPAGEGVMVMLADGYASTRNQYTLPVNNTTQKILSMDCGGLPNHHLVEHPYPGYIKHYAVGVRVETKFGTRFMQWYSYLNHIGASASIQDNGVNIFLNYPSPVETTSGYYQPTNVWNHFEVNIEEELQKLEPNNRLYKVVNFFTTGGFLDNITLSSPNN